MKLLLSFLYCNHYLFNSYYVAGGRGGGGAGQRGTVRRSCESSTTWPSRGNATLLLPFTRARKKQEPRILPHPYPHYTHIQCAQRTGEPRRARYRAPFPLPLHTHVRNIEFFFSRMIRDDENENQDGEIEMILFRRLFVGVVLFFFPGDDMIYTTPICDNM